MRTVKRTTLALNEGKKSSLKCLCAAYTREKRYWLDSLKSYQMQGLLGSHRKIRDQFVKEGYASTSGLQARHWKLALQDAVETWDRYWQAIFVKIRPKIFKHCFNENERHYAYFLIKGYEQFAELMQGGVPQVSFELDFESRKRISGYVRRLVKRFKGKAPTVRKARTVKFDPNCYDLFEHKGRQYVKLMSLERGKRIIVPLEGKSNIKGNITLVLSNEAIQIHASQDLPKKVNPLKNVVAVDFGYTEVMTDVAANRYGTQFGKILTKRSDQLCQKMKRRNSLHALVKNNSCPQKAHRIRRCNLGRQKLTRTKQKSAASLKCEINQAINQLIKTTHPAILITEDLSHLFSYDKSKVVNRRLSSWLRGEIQDRISFKALAEGFRHEQVNPAYGSQACPKCDFVDSKNRIADRFMCLHCRHEDIADRIAALNYAKRYGDPEISLYTPYREVKTILLDRFQRRLEADIRDCSGQDSRNRSRNESTKPVEIENIIAGRESSHENRTVNQRAKQNKYVSIRF
jgi:putative transposase